MTDNRIAIPRLISAKRRGGETVSMRFRRAPRRRSSTIVCAYVHIGCIYACIHARVRHVHALYAYMYACMHTGSRSTGIWHKADISISTGILPTIPPRRRHGTTLSAETCIPVISLAREPRETGAASVAIVRRRRTSYYRPSRRA